MLDRILYVRNRITKLLKETNHDRSEGSLL